MKTQPIKLSCLSESDHELLIQRFRNNTDLEIIPNCHKIIDGQEYIFDMYIPKYKLLYVANNITNNKADYPIQLLDNILDNLSLYDINYLFVANTNTPNSAINLLFDRTLDYFKYRINTLKPDRDYSEYDTEYDRSDIETLLYMSSKKKIDLVHNIISSIKSVGIVGDDIENYLVDYVPGEYDIYFPTLKCTVTIISDGEQKNDEISSGKFIKHFMISDQSSVNQVVRTIYKGLIN